MGKKKNKKQLMQSASLTDDDIQQKAIYDWSIYRNTHVGANHKEYIKSRINHYQQIRDNAKQKLQKAQSVQNDQLIAKKASQPAAQGAPDIKEAASKPTSTQKANDAAQDSQNVDQAVQASNPTEQTQEAVQLASSQQTQPSQDIPTSQNQPVGKDEGKQIDKLPAKDQKSESDLEKKALPEDHFVKQKDDHDKDKTVFKQSVKQEGADKGHKEPSVSDSDEASKTTHEETKKTAKHAKKPSKRKQTDTKLTLSDFNPYQTILKGDDVEKAKQMELSKKSQTIRMPNRLLFACVQTDVQKALLPERERFKKEYDLDFGADLSAYNSPTIGTYLAIFIGGNLPKLSRDQLGADVATYEAIQVYRRYKLTAQGEIQNKRYNHLYSNQLNLRDTVDSIFYLLAWYAGNTRFQFSDTPDSLMGPSKDQLENFDVMTNQTSMLAKTIKDEIVAYNRAQQNDKYRQH